MDAGPRGPVLVPAGQPIDLFVSVTDFAGHSMPLSLHSPPRVTEQEHRLILHFRQDGRTGKRLDDVPGLAVAARATASFPGAFRSEEHTSELQSLMRLSYAVFCLKTTQHTIAHRTQQRHADTSCHSSH